MGIDDLVIKARQGDSEAFGQIYDQFAGRLFRYIRIKIQNQQEAEDVLQEVFIKAYRGLAGVNMEGLNFSAWIYKIAGNCVNDHFRKVYRGPVTTSIKDSMDLADKTSLEQEAATNSDMEIAIRAFALLPALYRQVLELRFIQDLSVRETAAVLGKSNLAVRLIQHRALKKMKNILSGSGKTSKLGSTIA